MSANERRAEIIRILEGRRRETAANLASQFGVSIRTIRYDILVLTGTHPIETVRGRGGCVRMIEGYHTYQNTITQDQQNLLLSIAKILDKSDSIHIYELLRTHGSIRNRNRIEELAQTQENLSSSHT